MNPEHSAFLLFSVPGDTLTCMDSTVLAFSTQDSVSSLLSELLSSAHLLSLGADSGSPLFLGIEKL